MRIQLVFVLSLIACGSVDDTTEQPTCTAGEFLGCFGEAARVCDEAGNIVDQPCTAGCNADAKRCNTCVPNAATCSADGKQLEHCRADGLAGVAEACSLGCVPDADDKPAHCGYVEPTFLPNVCDAEATQPLLETSGQTMLDTSDDAVCNGGIETPTTGPQICVIRYGTIRILGGLLRIRGARAVALVADHALAVHGYLDVSADGTLNGPGGGTVISGARAAAALGGGGAGFSVKGADGGSADPAGGGGGLGGALYDPLVSSVFSGGPRAAVPTFQQPNYPAPGGGGGALTLISCRNTVSVTGFIEAGGGGGGGGRDANLLGGNTNLVGGAGGGAGGYVVLQGASVSVTGYVGANGGGGGGGCSSDGCVGVGGYDAHDLVAMGGSATGQGGAGGIGGTATAPTAGLASFYSPGGGGGAAGRLQTFTPASGVATVTGTISPSFDANRSLRTR